MFWNEMYKVFFFIHIANFLQFFQIFTQKNNDSLYYDQSVTHVLGEEGNLIAQPGIINRSQYPENPVFLFNNKYQI